MIGIRRVKKKKRKAFLPSDPDVIFEKKTGLEYATLIRENQMTKCIFSYSFRLVTFNCNTPIQSQTKVRFPSEEKNGSQYVIPLMEQASYRR